ncbi:MAG: HU family DNA-binding protein, partial [Deltaproteobacteria bacterium]|nr:HU family DNA-binding protein [Deltaproteobacteria bacterium]
QTGEEIEISSRRILTFKPSQILKSAINRQDG